MRRSKDSSGTTILDIDFVMDVTPSRDAHVCDSTHMCLNFQNRESLHLALKLDAASLSTGKVREAARLTSRLLIDTNGPVSLHAV